MSSESPVGDSYWLSYSNMSVNCGITGMDRGCSFRLGLQGAGVQRSHLRAQQLLDMVESDRAVPRGSRAWSNSTNARPTLLSTYIIHRKVTERQVRSGADLSSQQCPMAPPPRPHVRGLRGMSTEKCCIILLILYPSV